MEKVFINLGNLTAADENNERFIVLGTWGRYSLIRRNATYQPWVVAAGYKPEAKAWDAGEYFSDLLHAALYIVKKEKEEMLIDSIIDIAAAHKQPEIMDNLADLKEVIK